MARPVRLLALAVVLASTATMASAATFAEAPALTIDRATVSAKWRESWLTGSLAFSGSAGTSADLTATVRPANRPGSPAAKATFSTATDGRYSRTVKLPARLLPGNYLLRVWGTSGTTKLTPIERTVTVPAPAEGVVDRAFTSTSKGGAATLTAKGPISVVWAHFHFLVPPKNAKLTASWYTPSFKWVGTVNRAYKADFDTFVRALPSLERGRWWCVLKSSGRVVKRVRLRIT
jgi:hypothetical protein